jgi:uncharacterized protein YceH (UPF0502 family)
VETALNAIERRVLGSLMEKSMAQPDYYPMTENAIVAACNQKQNRDPVMELDGDAVWSALEALRSRGLVGMVLPGPGARSKRFKHEVETHYEWPKRERAIMAELLLRGPQTAGELRTRCSRFVPFDNLEAVTIVLDNLAQRDPPLVTQLPREPGRSAVRYGHLLAAVGEPVSDNIAPDAPGQAVSAPASVAASPATAEPGPTATIPAPAADNSTEIENLQAELAEVHEELDELRRRLDALEARIG